LIPHEWVTAIPKRAEDAEFEGHVPAGEMVCRDLKFMVKNAVGVSGATLLINQQAHDLLTEDQKKALRLRNRPDRTPEQDAQLAAAEEALSAAKSKVTPEVKTLFAQEILPITNFIADHANIFAVKPLFMFDVANLGLSGGNNNGRTRYGIGGGLQIDVVLARFELGYVFALNRAPGDTSGNLVGRLVFRRFF
jgi:hypothetical protein